MPYTITAPFKRSDFQQKDFGTISYSAPTFVITSASVSSGVVSIIGPSLPFSAGQRIVVSASTSGGGTFTVLSKTTANSIDTVTYSNAAAPSGSTITAILAPSTQIDEIIVGNIRDGDPNSVDFIKRYNTWFIYTQMEEYPQVPYKIIFIRYDATNQVAYTYSDTLKITRTL